MIYLYRKVRDHRRKQQQQQQQQQQEDGGQPLPLPPSNEEEKLSTWQIWKPRLLLLSAVVLPVILETLDYTVVATAQSNIASIFNRLDLQSYIGTSYVLGSTVFLPIGASLADVFGRYPTMQFFLFLFLVGSAISTGANNMPALLVGRGISGVGSAGLLGVVRIIMADSSSLDDNNAQTALMILAYTVGYTLGPVLGGLLYSANWRWVFAINLPVCVASMLLVYLILPKISKGPQPPQRLNRLSPHLASELASTQSTSFFGKLERIDFIGSLLFVVLGVLILLGLNWGSTESWNQPKVIICLAVGAALLVVFIGWEYIVDHSTDHLEHAFHHNNGKETDDMESDTKGNGNGNGNRARLARHFAPSWTRLTDPMLPMNMFRSFDVVATDFASLASGMVMLGIFYFVAIFYVIVNGRDAVGAGVQLLYFAPGIGAGVIVSTRLIAWLRQPRPIIILSSIILPIGIGLLAKALYEGSQRHILGYMILTGAGVGMGFGPLSYQARFSQPEERVAIVVTSNLFFRTAGGTVGLAQLYAVMYSRVRRYITQQAVKGVISPQEVGQIVSALSNVGNTHGGNNNSNGNGSGSGGILDLPDRLKEVATLAFRDGLQWAFWSLIPWLVVAFVMCCFLSRIPEERLNRKPGQYANMANTNANNNADNANVVHNGADNTATPPYAANFGGHDHDTTGSGNFGGARGDQKRWEGGQPQQYPMVNIREAATRV
ncbi:hypothetical protein FRC19_009684 [Serendipita sp. 401]|nr:hypothetical protein FRC15_000304 [Serendipita sp. 397]KAG8819563.1 hypothetical protein FRC19_009684 [Serendipita sp. 401]